MKMGDENFFQQTTRYNVQNEQDNYPPYKPVLLACLDIMFGSANDNDTDNLDNGNDNQDNELC